MFVLAPPDCVRVCALRDAPSTTLALTHPSSSLDAQTIPPSRMACEQQRLKIRLHEPYFFGTARHTQEIRAHNQQEKNSRNDFLARRREQILRWLGNARPNVHLQATDSSALREVLWPFLHGQTSNQDVGDFSGMRTIIRIDKNKTKDPESCIAKHQKKPRNYRTCIVNLILLR